MTSFSCHLCTRAGRISGKRHGNNDGASRSLICEDCHAMLASQGRVWCQRKRMHVVAASDYDQHRHCCKACRSLHAPPEHALPAPALAKRLYVHTDTLIGWLRRGWPVRWKKLGRTYWIEDRTSYPSSPDGRATSWEKRRKETR